MPRQRQRRQRGAVPIDEVAGIPIERLKVGLVEDLGLSESAVERRLCVLRGAEAICRRERLNLATLTGADLKRVVALLSETNRQNARLAFASLWEIIGRTEWDDLPEPKSNMVTVALTEETLQTLRELAQARDHLERQITTVVAQARRSVGVIGRVEQILGRRIDVDAERLYSDLLWELGEYAHRSGGGSAIGAAAIVQRVSTRHGVLSAGRLPLPRLTRTAQERRKDARGPYAPALPLDELIATVEGEERIGAWLELSDTVTPRRWRLSGSGDGFLGVFFAHKGGAWVCVQGARPPSFVVYRPGRSDPEDADSWSFSSVEKLAPHLSAFETGRMLPIPDQPEPQRPLRLVGRP